MAKVKIIFTEDEVRKIKALTSKDENGATVELCGMEPAFLEMGVAVAEEFPNDVDLFVTTLCSQDEWEKHWVCAFDRESLEAGVEYTIW